MEKLFGFCAALDRLNVRYGMQVVRDQAVMVTLVVPGRYFEIEFFVDGSVEIERFVSEGVDVASDSDLDDVLAILNS